MSERGYWLLLSASHKATEKTFNKKKKKKERNQKLNSNWFILKYSGL